MRTLSLDTSGETISAAALDGVCLIFEAFERTGQTHSARLLTLIESALCAAHWTMQDVERIAAVIGPGSYTGLRIGVSTARGLAQALNIPCVGVSSLEALAARATGLSFSHISPIIDARAGQVYAGLYDVTGETPDPVIPETACSIDEWLDALQRLCEHSDIPNIAFNVCGASSSAIIHTIKTRLANRAFILPSALNAITASAAGIIANARSSASYNALLPRYLRAPQAERERAARDSA